MMSVKKMIELYVSYELCEETWDMLYKMAMHGLISRDNWTKFWETCKGWSLDEDGRHIIDGDEKVVYKRDGNGFLVKA